jgi:3-hydroxyacyl-[acyl-carrier-protein] dehydratase
MVVLKAARAVKYGQFVEPGQTLRVTAEIVKQTDRETTLKTRGTVDGRSTVASRLVLERYNLGNDGPDRGLADNTVKQEMRDLFALLWQPTGERVESSTT